MSWGHRQSDRLMRHRHSPWKVAKRAPGSCSTEGMWVSCREPGPVVAAAVLDGRAWVLAALGQAAAHGWPVCHRAAVTAVGWPARWAAIRSNPAIRKSARRQGVEGTTLLKIHVSDRGLVEDVLIEHSAGHQDLDFAAMEAVKKWRFEPARQGNRSVAVWVMLPVRFTLR